MKIFRRLYLLLFAFLLMPFIGFSQWASATGDGYDIDMVTPNIAYIAGDIPSTQNDGFGYIYKTTNGGITTTKIFEKQNAYYRGVFFLNENKGFVVGSENTEGVILKTENGGTTWTRQVLPELYLHGVYFINEQVGFVYAGFSGVTIYKTIDGGTNWRKVAYSDSYIAKKMQFVSPKIGFLPTTHGLLKTTDAGETWQRLEKTIETPLNDTWFINESVGFATFGEIFLSTNSLIYRTSDGGETWEKIYTSETTDILNGIKFTSPLDGFVLERTDDSRLRILKTNDGGNTWQVDFSKNFPSFDLLSSIQNWDFSGNTAIAVGRLNFIRNGNFNSGINPNQPMALVSGNAHICPNTPARLRFDFTGNAPYSLILKNQNGISTPLSNITSNPYFYTVTPAQATTYSISDFKANNVIGRVGGSASFDNLIPSSATLLGGDDICLGENSKNVRLVLRGCPPFTVTIGDGFNRDSSTLIFQNTDTVSVFFKPKIGDANRPISYYIKSAKTGTGSEITDLKGSATFTVMPPARLELASTYPREVCPDAPINIDLTLYLLEPYSPYFITSTINNKTDTLQHLEYPISRYPIKLRETAAPIISIHTQCGIQNLPLDTIKVRTTFPTPMGLKAKEMNGRGVELTWNDYPENMFMGIQRRTPNSEWYELGEANTGDKRFFDDRANPSNTWEYRIYSHLSDEYCPSLFSNIATVTIDTLFKRTEIQQPALTNTDANALIWANWDKDSLPDILSYDGLSNNVGNRKFSGFYDDILKRTFNDGACIADIDNDGDIDFIGKYEGEAWLYCNKDNNTFDRKSLSNVLGGVNFESILQWIDYNQDGWVDLVCSQEDAISSNIRIILNNKNGTFSRLNNHPFVNESGRFFLADYDNDGDLDAAIYRGNDITFYRCNAYNLYTATDPIIVNAQYYTLGTASWWDIDGDGDLDLVVPNTNNSLFPAPTLYFKNNGGQWESTYLFGEDLYHFKSANIGDYNNDGWLDMVFVDNPGNSSGAFLMNRGSDTGFDLYKNGLITDGDYISNADVDRDGDLDLAVANGRVVLYENRFAGKYTKGNWLEIKLEGRNSDRLALGSIIRIKAKINGVSRWQIRYLSSSHSSRFGKDDLVYHFGLGDALVIDSVIVQWISGKKTILTNLPINKYMHLIENGTVNVGCSRAEPIIKVINNISNLCNKNGVIRLTTEKRAGETIKWYKGSNSTSQFVSNKDTLALVLENETAFYTVEIKDTVRGCPSIISSQAQQVLINNPNISFTALDSVICGNEYVHITPKSTNNTNFYQYFLEKYNTTNNSWVSEGETFITGEPNYFNIGGTYRFVAVSKSDNTCKTYSPTFNLRDGNTDITLSGKITLGSTPSVQSRVWLYSDRILVDSTITDINGSFLFKIKPQLTYQIKAASNNNQYNNTFLGGVVNINEAISLRSSKCENIKANIALLLKTPSSDISNESFKIKIYPNPSLEGFEIQAYSLKNEIIKVQIYDNQGKLILPEQEHFIAIGSQNIAIKNSEKLPQGIYLIRLSTSNNKDLYTKVLKIK